MTTLKDIINILNQSNKQYLTTGSYIFRRYSPTIMTKDSIRMRHHIREIQSFLYPTRSMSNKEIYQASFNRERTGEDTTNTMLSMYQRDIYSLKLEALEKILHTPTIEEQMDILMKMCYRIDLLEKDC